MKCFKIRDRAIQMIPCVVLLTFAGHDFTSAAGAHCSAEHLDASKKTILEVHRGNYAVASKLAENAAVIASNCPWFSRAPLMADQFGVDLLLSAEYAHYAKQGSRAKSLALRAEHALRHVRPPQLWTARLELREYLKEARADLGGHWPSTRSQSIRK